jgi:hypothetical protein
MSLARADFRACSNALLLVAVSFAAAVVVSVASAADSKPDREFAQKATWQIPTPQSVRDAALAWLATREVDAATRTQLDTLWASATTSENDVHRLDVLCATLAAADPQARELVSACSQRRHGVALPNVAWLADEKVPAIERNNLRLLYGRWLVQEVLYDEAADQLGELKPEEVVDPAALLFYQAVVRQRTLKRDEGLATIARLLEREAEVPKRYTSVARLMQADRKSTRLNSSHW